MIWVSWALGAVPDMLSWRVLGVILACFVVFAVMAVMWGWLEDRAMAHDRRRHDRKHRPANERDDARKAA